MNTVKRLSPMLIMVAFLAYSVYAIQASLFAPDAGESIPKKGPAIMVDDHLDVRAANTRSLASDSLPSPFQDRTKPGSTARQDLARLDPEPTPLAEIVKHLTLDATFLQGRNHLAIIDGAVYSQGQHLLLERDSGKSLSSLWVASVLPAKVILEAGGQSYELGYPEQLGRRPDKMGRAGSHSNGHKGALVKSASAGTAGPASAPRSRRHRG